MSSSAWLFGSLFFGGFECSTHLTIEGRRLDVIAATQHDRRAGEDYALCRDAGLLAVRESARWPVIDRGGALDLAGVRDLARIGRESGLVQIWDLMHYGYPDDLDPYAPEFVARFAAYARAVAQVVCSESEGPTFYTPINEISYTAWAGGEVGYMAPFGHGRGPEYKRNLVRAAIAAMEAIWAVDPGATMLNVDPLLHLHPPDGRPEMQPEADHFNRSVVTEAFDMLAGRLEPELGGSRRHLGLIGVNYYAGCQWTLPVPGIPQRFLGWDDPAWVPLSDKLVDLQTRYGGPIIIAETGSASDGRPGWLAHLTAQAAASLARGVDLQGICWYPVLTSPDWEDPTAFFDGGLFDVRPRPDGGLDRILALPIAAALREAQAALDPLHLPATPLPAEPPASPPPPLQFAKPRERARYKVDNFSCQTLFSGDTLTSELYCFEPGGSLPAHRHEHAEHILMIVSGQADVRIGDTWIRMLQGETVLLPAGLYHGIHNFTAERLIVQQVTGPKPWDARFAGPHPSYLRDGHDPSGHRT